MTARRQEREVIRDLTLDVAPAAAEQRAEASIEAELSAMVADEVEHGAERLPAGPSQAAAELLQEEGRALGRAQEQQGVDVRDVDTFVEQVDGEDDVDSPGVEIAQRRRSLVHRAVTPDRNGRYPDRAELLGHEARVHDRDAEAERLDRREVVRLEAHLFDDASRPRVIGGQHVGQRVRVVAGAALPRHVGQVGSVVHAEVRERHQVLLVDRVPHPQLGRDPSVEVAQHVEAVGALGCGGHAEELSRLQAFEEHLVRGRGGVMELVDDHDVEVRGID